MFTEKELQQFKIKGISEEKANWQLKQFVNGVKPVYLVEPATTNKGITQILNKEYYLNQYNSSKKKYTKFVPASGAASRMFKALYEFKEVCLNDNEVDINKYADAKIFFDNIREFAFYKELDLQCEAKGANIDSLLKENKYDIILSNLLDDSGLGYGNLPKGLLTFHKYSDNEYHTAFEEHLTEGARYAKSEDNTVNIHFTVSPEHMEAFKLLSSKVISIYEQKFNVKYNIEYSIQKPSTDTFAVTPDNKPFYDDDGTILFRPGGHGALIENLNDTESDIIFIKNIDNVVPDSKLDITVEYKKVIAGMLIELQNEVFSLIKGIQGDPGEEKLIVAKEFLEQKFYLGGTCLPDDVNTENSVHQIINRLNRPIRICGVVKNLGEPGGGPFITRDDKGCESPQIVESSQVNDLDTVQKRILDSATHFNPVDIVCSVKDYAGKKFNLLEFVDQNTCFISEKSKSGKSLKALELPGLWNGAMAGWNTVLIEVPVETFNPVKTVNDLIRDMHQ